VHDVKAEAYMPPFFAPTVGMAHRMFEDACKDENSQFSKHPEDFRLFEIGTWDDGLAMFENRGPFCLTSALQILAPVMNGKLAEVVRNG